MDEIKIKKIIQNNLVNLNLANKKFSIKFLGAGFMNDNWLVELSSQKYVFRIRKSKEFAKKHDRENHVLKKLDGRYGAPRLYFSSTGDEYSDGLPYSFIEFIRGEPINENDLTEEDVEYMGYFLSGLRTETFDYYQINSLSEYTHQDHKSLLVQAFKEYDIPEGIELEKLIINFNEQVYVRIHGDFRSINILSSGNNYRVIDWEKSKVSDPASEMGRALSYLPTENLQDIIKKSYTPDWLHDDWEFWNRVGLWYLHSLLDIQKWKPFDNYPDLENITRKRINEWHDSHTK